MQGRPTIVNILLERGYVHAERIVDYYLAEGIAKYDSTGKFSVVHGAFLDDDVLARAQDQVIKDNYLSDIADSDLGQGCPYCAGKPDVTGNVRHNRPCIK